MTIGEWPDRVGLRLLRSSVLVTTGAILAFAGEVARAQTADLCAQIASVAAKADSLHELAARPTAATEWDSKITVPGFSACRISRNSEGAMRFACTQPQPDIATAVSAARQMGATMRDRCLAGKVVADKSAALNPARLGLYEPVVFGAMDNAIVSIDLIKASEIRGTEVVFVPTVQLSIFSTDAGPQTKVAAKAPAPPAPAGPGRSLDLNRRLFCRDLKQLRLESKNGFKNIAYTDNDDIGSSLWIKGASNCYIADLETSGTRYQTCKFVNDGSFADAVTAAGELDREIMNCLGEAVVPRRRERDEGAFTISYVVPGPGESTMEVRVTTFRNVFDVSLDIDQPR